MLARPRQIPSSSLPQIVRVRPQKGSAIVAFCLHGLPSFMMALDVESELVVEISKRSLGC